MSEPLSSSGPHPEEERVVIRDKRRIDPTGETPLPEPATEESGASDEPGQLASELEIAVKEADELRGVAQRVQAEFANYRKRVDRDREAVSEQAAGRVVGALLPVLDNIDRAREHGDLEGAFKVVADEVEAVLGKFGLAAFGAVGDEFDPSLHEAVMHTESDEVSVPTCTTVMRRGYRQGERLLRPAMVGVSEPSIEAAGGLSADEAEAGIDPAAASE